MDSDRISSALIRKEVTALQWYMNRTGLTQLQKQERKRLLREIGSKVFNVFF